MTRLPACLPLSVALSSSLCAVWVWLRCGLSSFFIIRISHHVPDPLMSFYVRLGVCVQCGYKVKLPLWLQRATGTGGSTECPHPHLNLEFSEMSATLTLWPRDTFFRSLLSDDKCLRGCCSRSRFRSACLSQLYDTIVAELKSTPPLSPPVTIDHAFVSLLTITTQ